MSENQPSTPDRQDQKKGIHRRPLQVLNDLMPGLDTLAVQSGSSEVETHVRNLRETVASVLRQKEETDALREARDTRLVRWARIPGTPFKIQGMLIRRNAPLTARIAADVLAQADGQTTLTIDDLKTAGFRTVKTLAMCFDPQEPTKDFDAWTRPYILAGLRYCISKNAIAIPDQVSMKFLDILRKEDAASQEPPRQSTAEEPAAPPPPTETQSPASASASATLVEPADSAPAVPPSPPPPEPAVPAPAPKETEPQPTEQEEKDKNALRAARDTRLIRWAAERQIHRNPFGIQGELIRRSMHLIVQIGHDSLTEADGQTTLTTDNLMTAGFRIVKGLAREFDPQELTDDFNAYARPYILAGLRYCISKNAIAIPDQVSMKFLDILRKEDSAPQEPPRQSTAEEPATPPPHTKTQAPKKPAQPKPAEQTRTDTLIAWAAAQSCYMGDGTTFGIQGEIASHYLPWAIDLSGNYRAQTSDVRSLDREEWETICFTLVNTLARMFDPSEHGQDFQAFAQPFLLAAFRQCVRAEENCIPDHLSPQQLQAILAAETIGQTWQENPIAAGARAVHSHTAKKNGEDRVPPAPTPPEPPAPTAVESPPPEPAAPEPTQEQKEETKRQRRFCRWAKDEHKIQVTPEQFEEAVAAIAHKFEPFVGGAVSKRKGNIPPRFRGGRTKVQSEVIHALPRVIREFDPNNGEHFNAFLQRHVDAMITDILEGRQH